MITLLLHAFVTVVASDIAIVILLLLKIYSISVLIITKLQIKAVICLEQETAQEKIIKPEPKMDPGLANFITTPSEVRI